MANTYSDSKSFYYKYTNPTDVWGNSVCKVIFCNSLGKTVYSRNTWYHHLNVILNEKLLPPIFVYWIPNSNIAITYEYERPSIYDLVAIDFDKNQVFRFSLLNKSTNEYSKENILELILQNSVSEKLMVEKVEKPLFSFWKQ